MAVQFLTYRGKKYPIKLGQYSMQRFQEEHDAQIEDLDQNTALFEPLVFFALKQGARVEKQELDLTEEDMVDFLDDCMMDFVDKIPKFFPGVDPEEFAVKIKEVGGKKRTGTKSVGKQSPN